MSMPVEQGFQLTLIAGKIIILDKSEVQMTNLTRITFNPEVMGGKPCIRGMRVTVGMIVGMIATGKTREEILKLYPYLETQDIDEALSYAAWRAEESEAPLKIV